MLLRLSLPLALIALTPLLAMAQTSEDEEQPLWYQIELFIYANNDPAARDNEQWQQYPRLRYPANTRQLIPLAPAIATLPATLQPQPQLSPAAIALPEHAPQALQLLPRQDRELRYAASRVIRQADFRELFHQVWRQQLQSRDSAPSLVISGGDRFGNHFELEGTVTVAVDRYLHVETDLWLSTFSNSAHEQVFPHHRLPPRPSSAQGAQAIKPRLDHNYTIENIALMRQKRRMRSNELHYIDHPSMALLVKITRYEPPAPEVTNEVTSEDTSPQQ